MFNNIMITSKKKNVIFRTACLDLSSAGRRFNCVPVRLYSNKTIRRRDTVQFDYLRCTCVCNAWNELCRSNTCDILPRLKKIKKITK